MLKRVLGVVLLIVAAAGSVVWYGLGRVDVERVREDLYMLTGIGGNVGVLVTDEGVVVVDTMTVVRQGDAILRRVRELTDKPVVAILDTHYHLDHTHGNPAFQPGTKVIATGKTLQHLRERDGEYWRDSPARDLLPNITFDVTHELRLGGRTIRAHHLGRGHTDGDLVVLFVEDHVLQAGDLFFNGHFPDIDLEAGGSVREWPATLERALALDFDTVIPGHGPVSDRAGMKKFQQLMSSLWSQTKTVVDRRGSLEQAIEVVDIEHFGLRVLWWNPLLNRGFVIRRAYEEARPRPAR